MPRCHLLPARPFGVAEAYFIIMAFCGAKRSDQRPPLGELDRSPTLPVAISGSHEALPRASA
jgi:hypothetical protein